MINRFKACILYKFISLTIMAADTFMKRDALERFFMWIKKFFMQIML